MRLKKGSLWFALIVVGMAMRNLFAILSLLQCMAEGGRPIGRKSQIEGPLNQMELLRILVPREEQELSV